ncbi:SLAM family member 5-like [Pelobates fuscus]|uniref:SLAM family member 5-like n=1 Tax=Pelobates fuscus TaxID=191477 RepID=UPI002FE46254
MIYIHIWILIFIFLPKSILCADLCGDKRKVFGAVSGEVVLPLNQTAIKDIAWVIANIHFATTRPDGEIDIRYNRYEGRLYGTADGSLNFTKLTSEDQGEYTAYILTGPKIKFCEQQYDLRIFRKLLSEDMEILPSVTRNGTCSVILFCMVNGSDVNITWISSNSTEINVVNGSLHITDTNNIFTCTAKNPVSTISRTVNPQRYCRGDVSDVLNLQTMSTAENSLLCGVFIAKGFAVVIVGLFLGINLLLTRKQVFAQSVLYTCFTWGVCCLEHWGCVHFLNDDLCSSMDRDHFRTTKRCTLSVAQAIP